MKINKPKIEFMGNEVKFSALVESPQNTKLLWYTLDKQFSELICDFSDAALVALLIPAMVSGQDIYLEGSVSERLWYTLANQYQSMLKCQIPWLQKIKIFPTTVAVRNNIVSGVATGFSAGIDSFCLLADHFYSSIADGFKVTHLLFNNVGSHGSGKIGENLFEQRYEHIKNITKRLNLPFIKVNSNVDSFYENYGESLDFERTHTPRNASVALLLQNGLKRYMYASAYSFSDIKIKPSRSMGISDPISLSLLSTETLDTLSVGSEYTRVEKTLRVAEIADSYEKLNVCVSGSAKNCSQCWKCMRTLLTLEIGGVIKRFANAFDIDIYHERRDQYITEIMNSEDPLIREVIEFAKKTNFELLLRETCYT